jgi:hypothetical protein
MATLGKEQILEAIAGMTVLEEPPLRSRRKRPSSPWY